MQKPPQQDHASKQSARTAYDRQQDRRPPQHQERQPGQETEMRPQPIFIRPNYRGSGRLAGRASLITGGDSGIGRAVAVHFAREGADIAIVHHAEQDDAEATGSLVEAEGQRCVLLRGDVAEPADCRRFVARTLQSLGRLDVLVNNAAEQHPQDGLQDIDVQQLDRTFRTNIYGYFFLTQIALPHLPVGSAIINTTSVTAYRGSGHLIDYAATKGAIVAFTRSLAKSLVERGIRVNGVAPGPIWTPLIPASFSAGHVEQFGSQTLMGRAGQPAEVAPCFVFLACEDASYMTGQVLHPNGGDFIET